MNDTEKHLASVEKDARDELSARAHEIEDGRLDGQWWFLTVLKGGFKKTRERERNASTD